MDKNQEITEKIADEFFSSIPCKTKKIDRGDIMNKQDFINDVNTLKEIFIEFNSHQKGLSNVGIDDLEIYDVFYKLINFSSTQICKRFDINEEAFDWLVYEDDFGHNKYTCSYPDDVKSHIIDSIESFWNFEKKEFN